MKIRGAALRDLFEAAGPEIRMNALFDRIAGQHVRLRLDRDWGDGPRALVCMSNPSDASAQKNDPTIGSLNRLLKALDFGGYSAVNEIPYISPSPAACAVWRSDLARDDPEALAEVCHQNVAMILGLSKVAAVRIVAWGNLVKPSPDAQAVLAALSTADHHPLMCFGQTKDGAPKHPGARGEHRITVGSPLEVWDAGPFLEKCE